MIYQVIVSKYISLCFSMCIMYISWITLVDLWFDQFQIYCQYIYIKHFVTHQQYTTVILYYHNTCISSLSKSTNTSSSPQIFLARSSRDLCRPTRSGMGADTQSNRPGRGNIRGKKWTRRGIIDIKIGTKRGTHGALGHAQGTKGAKGIQEGDRKGTKEAKKGKYGEKASVNLSVTYNSIY